MLMMQPPRQFLTISRATACRTKKTRRRFFAETAHITQNWQRLPMALFRERLRRDTMDETWEEWNARIEKLIAELEATSIPYVPLYWR
jgi:hypothetical protein